MNLKRFGCVILALLCCGGGAGCSDTPSSAAADPDTQNPIVTMEIEGLGTIKMELYPDIAPKTVANFVNLVEDGFYDGLNFHRAEEGFVIQGGSPMGDGTGGPGWSIEGEFGLNGIANDLKHERGVLSMARGSSNNSGGSQFFIMLDTSKGLDGSYAAFGKVTDEASMEVVDAIAALPTRSVDQLRYIVDPPIITKATVDTFGKTYTADKIQ